MLRVIVALALVAVALVAFARWFEPRFAFFPEPGETTTPADFGVEFEAKTVTTADGERLHAWLLHGRLPRALIVYCHGNGGNLSVWAPILSDVARHGYDVLAFDYRGYGLSTGRPSEQGLYRDTTAIIEHAWSLPGASERVVYWGRSLGSAVAAYAGTRHAPDGIVIEAGFPDARALLRTSPVLAFLGLFSTYRFPTAAFLDRVQRPLLVIHGDRDRIVPFALGRALFERTHEPKTFVAIPGGDHNDERPADEHAYWGAVDAFIRDLPARRAGI